MPHAEVTIEVRQIGGRLGSAIIRESRPSVRSWSATGGCSSPHRVWTRSSSCLAANVGSDARSLAKGASGGELSRVMLALEVSLAGTSPVPTFVFDEVDAGVGGKAAVEVGRRLAQLAQPPRSSS